MFQLEEQNISQNQIEYAYAGVLQPKTGKMIIKYEEIIKYQDLYDTWLE